MNPKNLLFLPLGLLLLVAAVNEAQAEGGCKSDTRQRAVGCVGQPIKNCCALYHWDMTLDPRGYKARTGCDPKCCSIVWNERDRVKGGSGGRYTGVERRRGGAAVTRQFVNNLLNCVTELLVNISSFKLSLPQSCCELPLVSFLPFCWGGGGGGGGDGPPPGPPGPPAPRPPRPPGPPGPPYPPDPENPGGPERSLDDDY